MPRAPVTIVVFAELCEDNLPFANTTLDVSVEALAGCIEHRIPKARADTLFCLRRRTFDMHQ